MKRPKVGHFIGKLSGENAHSLWVSLPLWLPIKRLKRKEYLIGNLIKADTTAANQVTPWIRPER